MKDLRAVKYIQSHGEFSWEVDALKPEILNEILRTEILNNINYDTFEDIKNSEEKDRTVLRKIIKDNF